MRRSVLFLLTLLAAAPPTLTISPTPASGSLTSGPIERIHGIYLQQGVELATVGTRTVRLTRMTRFRRCGRLGAMAQDFNEHLVEVAGREVDGIGFVAGFVNAIESCPSAAAHSAVRAQ